MWVDSSSDVVPHLPTTTTSSNYNTNTNSKGRGQGLSGESSIPIPVEIPMNSPSSSDGSRPMRWGRSNFTEDEIQALETPLEESHPHDYANPYEDHPSQDTPVFFSNQSTDEPCVQNQGSRIRQWFQKILKAIFILLPALCFAAAAHFINDIMTDFQLFSASFSVFQGVFWPSFVFFVIDLIQGGRKRDGNDPSGCIGLFCLNRGWKVALLLLLHSTLASTAMIMQLLSIQRLNISVSLALSFSSEVYVILLSYINREKRFSLELILCSVLTYLGFIIIGIPAMTSQSLREAEDLTTGLVASLASMGLIIPTSFLLRHLRNSRVPDSLTATSFAFFGSLFSWIVKFIMDATISLDINFDPISIGWASGLISLVLVGTTFLTVQPKVLPRNTIENGPLRYCNISRTRILIFVFSCVWELIRQGVWHTSPGVFDIFGSVAVIVGFLLAVGFEAWTFAEPDEVKKSSFPFQFIQWLFSRQDSKVWNKSSARYNNR